jgi:hypothetical protein
MKKSILAICVLLFISNMILAQPAANFYRQHKRLEGVKNFKIPGWLVYFGTGITHDIVKNEETKSILKLARKVGKMRIMIAEETNPIPVSAVNNLVTESRSGGYEDLIYVRDDETTVSIMGKIKKDKFKRLLFLVNDGSDFIFFEMKSRIRVKDITELINLATKKTPLEKKKETPKQKRKQKTQDIPRV